MAVQCRIDALKVGQRVDLEADRYADPAYYAKAQAREPYPEEASDHPEFQYAYEVVMAVVRERPDVTRVDFESGFSCGFPPAHRVDVDPEQTF